MTSPTLKVRHRTAAVVRRRQGLVPVRRTSSPGRERVRGILRGARPQAKAIEVGASSDPLEVEADRVADRLQRSPTDEVEPAPEEEKVEEQVQRVQRQAEPMPEASADDVGTEEPEAWPAVEEGELEELGTVRRKALSGGEGFLLDDPALARAIADPGPGRQIPGTVRKPIERGLKRDLSHVRLHDAPPDRSLARRLRARAFTFGSHVWLGPGESIQDRRLLSHELVHVVQQGAAKRTPEDRLGRTGRKVQRGLWDDFVEGAKSLAGSVSELAGDVKTAVLGKLEAFARDLSGYPLLTVVLGKDPISDRPVERNAKSVVRAIIGLIPGGATYFERLNESGAFERAHAWFQEAIGALDLTWDSIKGLFRRAWDSLSVGDVMNPAGAWAKIKTIFGPPLSRIKKFAVEAGKMFIEFIFEGALLLAGPLARQVLAVVRKIGTTFRQIIADPVGFLRNLLAAVAGGFRQFKDNILTHLKAGLLGWLFGTMAKAGIQLPEKFDLKGIVSLVLQILGLTYARVRQKLVKVIGEKRVAFLEKGLEFVRLLVTEGLPGVWRKLLEYIGNLQEMVMGQVRNWVVTKVIQSAVTKLVSMFNPVGAVVQAVIMTYNVVSFFIERIKQILAVVNSIVDSIASIAEGKLQAAANYVEATMARTLPVIISFLANLVGLGGIAGKIRSIIEGIQEKVDTALSKLVNFIVSKAKALFSAGKEAVGSVKDWLKKRLPFKVGEESHEMFFEEGKAGPELMVASKKETYEKFLARIEEDLEAQKENPRYAEHARIYGEAVRLHKKLKRTKKFEGIDELKTRTATLMESLRSDGPGEASKITWPGGRTREKFAKKMQADPLTVKNPGWEGSDTGSAESNDVWDKVKRRKSGKRSYYVRGHLLNADLHGPGEWKNLSPISQTANGRHYREVEKIVKDVVFKKGNYARYIVTARYDRSNQVTPKQADEKLDKVTGLSTEDRRVKRDVMIHEHLLPDAFICTAEYREPTDEKRIWKPIAGVTREIPSKRPIGKVPPI